MTQYRKSSFSSKNYEENSNDLPSSSLSHTEMKDLLDPVDIELKFRAGNRSTLDLSPVYKSLRIQ